MEAYIEDKKYLYASIHEFLEETEESDDDEFNRYRSLNKLKLLEVSRLKVMQNKCVYFLKSSKALVSIITAVNNSTKERTNFYHFFRRNLRTYFKPK